MNGCIVGLLAAAACVAGPGRAGAEARYKLKLAFVIAAGTPIDVAARRYAELVRQRTNGEVEISVHPAGELGGERAIIERVQMGAIEMSLTSTGAIGAFAPEFQVLDLPYLFPSYEAAYAFLDGDYGKRLLSLLDRRGLHGLVYMENGWRNFTTNKKPLRRPEDLRGQKIRVMESPLYMSIVRALKATPAPMAYPEILNALSQREIDGQENPAVNIYSAGLYDAQRYMVYDRHTYNVFIFKVNSSLWGSLPDNLRRIIESTAVEVRDFQRKLNREADAEFVRRLQAKGMEVYIPSPADEEAWRKATSPVYDDAMRFLGETWVMQAVRFRKDWDAGKHRDEPQRSVKSSKTLTVPLEKVMKQAR